MKKDKIMPGDRIALQRIIRNIQDIIVGKKLMLDPEKGYWKNIVEHVLLYCIPIVVEKIESIFSYLK